MVFLCLFYCSIWSTTPKLCLYMVFILKSKRPRTTLVLNTRFIFRSVLAFFARLSNSFYIFLQNLPNCLHEKQKVLFVLFYQLFWTQLGCPEGIGTNGTHRSLPWLVGLARRVIHPVESPFFDGRVTLLAGQTFRLVNTSAHSAGSTRSRQDNQSMRERYPRQ